MTNARSDFEDRLPEINRLAGFQFKYLDPDAREEAVQNAVVLAYRYWTRLVERGKTEESVFRGAICWACTHTPGTPGWRIG
jgi:hypothetical protein